MKRPIGYFTKIHTVEWYLIIILGLISLIGCEAEKGGRILIEKKLREIKVGSVVKLSDLINEQVNVVCVLPPYRDKVIDRYPENEIINNYLESIKYQANEGYWLLLLLTSNSTKHYTFKRSKSLDIGGHFLEKSKIVGLPVNFEIAECASFNEAAFFKTSTIGDRNYMMFGRIK